MCPRTHAGSGQRTGPGTRTWLWYRRTPLLLIVQHLVRCPAPVTQLEERARRVLRLLGDGHNAAWEGWCMELSLVCLVLALTLFGAAFWRAMGERVERVRNPNTDALWCAGLVAFVLSVVSAAAA